MMVLLERTTYDEYNPGMSIFLCNVDECMLILSEMMQTFIG
jgi:hypothetical protein